MLLSQQTVEREAILALWEITESVDDLLDLLDLDPFIIEQVFSFTSEKRQLEYLAVRAMLKTVLGEKKVIAYELNGKPYLCDHSYQISITHTGKYVAILLHPTCRLGVDVERMSDKLVRVQSKFLSEQERHSVDSVSPKIHLALLWSAKETLYKMMQQTEVDFIKHLAIKPFQPYQKGVMEATECRTAAAETFELSYQIFPEFVLVWALKD